jgi:hypothetical protein
MALVLVSLALLSPIRADEKMNKDSAADDFAAGMEGLNVDETKHRPVFILPRPFPVSNFSIIILTKNAVIHSIFKSLSMFSSSYLI